MIGWTVSIAMFSAWVAIPDANALVLCASGLFAIAGSIGIGLDKIARKMS